MSDKLIVRVTIAGRASRRWRGAANAAQADQLNQQLSEARARNLRKPVEDILKKQLPGVQIEVVDTALGSHHGFPLTGEDNDAMDRSVVVMIELTSAIAGSKVEYRPTKILAPSYYWRLKVVSMVGASGGAAGTFMRVKVINTVTWRELTLAGYLFGGLYTPKGGFSFGHKDQPDPNSQVGDTVTFHTKEAEDFHFWVGSENGQWARLIHSEVGLVRKREMTALEFTSCDTYPDGLVFEYEKGWTLATLGLGIQFGFLKVEGPVPSDYVDGTTMVTVPTQRVGHNYDGVLVSFPTGKAAWNDLTPKDHKRLTDFVTSKALAIAAIGQQGFRVVNPRP